MVDLDDKIVPVVVSHMVHTIGVAAVHFVIDQVDVVDVAIMIFVVAALLFVAVFAVALLPVVLFAIFLAAVVTVIAIAVCFVSDFAAAVFFSLVAYASSLQQAAVVIPIILVWLRTSCTYYGTEFCGTLLYLETNWYVWNSLQNQTKWSGSYNLRLLITLLSLQTLAYTLFLTTVLNNYVQF